MSDLSDSFLVGKRRILVGDNKIERVHELKIDRELWGQVATNQKTFEIRYNDRGFRVGDDLLLRAVVNTGGGPPVYTGQWVFSHVMFILDDEKYGMKPGYVIMATKMLIFDHADTWKHYPAIRNHILNSQP